MRSRHLGLVATSAVVAFGLLQRGASRAQPAPLPDAPALAPLASRVGAHSDL